MGRWLWCQCSVLVSCNKGINCFDACIVVVILARNQAVQWNLMLILMCPCIYTLRTFIICTRNQGDVCINANTEYVLMVYSPFHTVPVIFFDYMMKRGKKLKQHRYKAPLGHTATRSHTSIGFWLVANMLQVFFLSRFILIWKYMYTNIVNVYFTKSQFIDFNPILKFVVCFDETTSSIIYTF